MFIVRRMAAFTALILLSVFALEHGHRFRALPGALLRAGVWGGRLAVIATLVWAVLAFRGRESPTVALGGHGGEMQGPQRSAEVDDHG